VARFPSRRYGRLVRLESVQNAIDQAKAAADAMLGGSPSYDPVPWFWSDQYDAKLQIAGLSAGHGAVEIEGDPAAGPFAVAYRDGARLLAVDTINWPRRHMEARRSLAEGP
jgi:3-phenylpropionate/trans-cinnamate dioxygenase ferredoxin reductase subunit